MKISNYQLAYSSAWLRREFNRLSVESTKLAGEVFAYRFLDPVVFGKIDRKINRRFGADWSVMPCGRISKVMAFLDKLSREYLARSLERMEPILRLSMLVKEWTGRMVAFRPATVHWDKKVVTCSSAYDTEGLLHEFCHWITATPAERKRTNLDLSTGRWSTQREWSACALELMVADAAHFKIETDRGVHPRDRLADDTGFDGRLRAYQEATISMDLLEKRIPRAKEWLVDALWEEPSLNWLGKWKSIGKGSFEP